MAIGIVCVLEVIKVPYGQNAVAAMPLVNQIFHLPREGTPVVQPRQDIIVAVVDDFLLFRSALSDVRNGDQDVVLFAVLLDIKPFIRAARALVTVFFRIFMTLDKAVIVLCDTAGKQRFGNMVVIPAIVWQIQDFKKFVCAVHHVILGIKFAHAQRNASEFDDLRHLVSKAVDRDILFLDRGRQIVKFRNARSGQRAIPWQQLTDSIIERVDGLHKNMCD